jgi:hypothetical protein
MAFLRASKWRHRHYHFYGTDFLYILILSCLVLNASHEKNTCNKKILDWSDYCVAANKENCKDKNQIGKTC